MDKRAVLEVKQSVVQKIVTELSFIRKNMCICAHAATRQQAYNHVSGGLFSELEVKEESFC